MCLYSAHASVTHALPEGEPLRARGAGDLGPAKAVSPALFFRCSGSLLPLLQRLPFRRREAERERSMPRVRDFRYALTDSTISPTLTLPTYPYSICKSEVTQGFQSVINATKKSWRQHHFTSDQAR